MTQAPLLKYYNPGEELTEQCDASDKGLGAALIQNGQPIAFASRALTEPETRYAQIEKEMLAVVFALQKFDQYVYGRPATVQSDHKPLAAISNKPLRSAPKRLQGMLLKVQKYDVSIVYKPGPEMYLATTTTTTHPEADAAKDERSSSQLTHRRKRLFEESQRVHVLTRHGCGTEGVHFTMRDV